MIDSIVQVEGLRAGYGERLVLDGVSFDVPRGSITCIIGGSGCGKSTLLRCLVGLLRPRGGTVHVLGEDVAALDERGRERLLPRVGFMFQYGALLGSLTVADNLAIPARAHTDLPRDVVGELVRIKLAMVGLADAGGKLPSELSGGMRKRAGLARALMLDPPLLLCDEPSAGLDPLTAADIDALLLDLRALLGLTLVVVTHELASIRLIADRVVMLHEGRVHFDGPLDEALGSDDPLLVRFFQRKPSLHSTGPRPPLRPEAGA